MDRDDSNGMGLSYPCGNNCRANWDALSLELRDRLQRLNEYTADGEIFASRRRDCTGTTHYGPVKQPAEALYASVKCTGCLCYGHLATACPRRPVPEVHMVEVFNSNVGEVCDEYNCHACASDINARKVIIIESGCNAHMFSDWRVSRNFRTRRMHWWGTGSQ